MPSYFVNQQSNCESILNFNQVTFLKSAATLAQSPDDNGIEVAFVGRSNAGKSSALNTITGQNKLARTSKTPGRTQLMNYFELSANKRLVDLPGYGFAKIPQSIQKQIQHLLMAYLTERDCLKGLVLLMDSRHPLTKNDQQLIEMMISAQKPLHILLTKCDKLSRNQQLKVLNETQKALKSLPLTISVQLFSAHDKTGLDKAHEKLQEWFHDEK